MITIISEARYFQIGQDVKLEQGAHFMEAVAEADRVVVASPGSEGGTQWCLVSSAPGSSIYTLDTAESMVIYLFFS